ncbi:hypothetical protein M752DRAFT_274711 [Aspergillus phoenicis ATCC 13157]|uniref:Uncharacterized protein n=1 Tax=Aspergillus phoenicis ATCC 13157 TaxID=1353007 RepID=A0A370PQ88_ASPPH|nr:hypothetical protein M752DRAFT_274711 [Aspergillus phoenicis ATCC 13157]
MKSTTTTTSSARLQNDFGADLWVKNPPKHHPTAGRGLFAGLQDTKNYNVESGWAKRSNVESQGLLGSLLSRFIGGSYKPPTD